MKELELHKGTQPEKKDSSLVQRAARVPQKARVLFRSLRTSNANPSVSLAKEVGSGQFRSQILSDGRTLTVYFEFSGPKGGAQLDIHIRPSQQNPVGLETEERRFRGVEHFRGYKGLNKWIHVGIVDESDSVLSSYLSFIDLPDFVKVEATPDQVARIKEMYGELTTQVLEVLQGKRDNIDVVVLPAQGLTSIETYELSRK